MNAAQIGSHVRTALKAAGGWCLSAGLSGSSVWLCLLGLALVLLGAGLSHSNHADDPTDGSGGEL